MNLLDYIPGIPDFPKPGILFRDVSPLLAHAGAFRQAIHSLAELAAPFGPTHIAAIEARGFVFGSALSYHLGRGFVLVRKSNKLPQATHRESYGLEYGSDVLEIQQHSLPPGAKVLIVDDVLATGGTVVATAKLIANAGFAVCGAISLLEIVALQGAGALGRNQISFKSLLRI